MQPILIMSVQDRLIQLIEESGESFAEVSRKIGKNPTYLQQFVRYGRPAYLPELVRHKLAQHFQVDEREFRDPEYLQELQIPKTPITDKNSGKVEERSDAFLSKKSPLLSPKDKQKLLTIYGTLTSLYQEQGADLAPTTILERALEELERQKGNDS